MTRAESRNAPFREASRRKVDPKTGWGEGRSPALFKADRTRGSVCLPVVHALSPCGSCAVCLWSMLSLLSLLVVHSSFFSLLVVHSLPRSSCGSGLPVVQLFLWSALWSCGATCCRRHGPVTSPGDASETRAEGAALPAAWCEPARLGEESAGESSPTTEAPRGCR